MTEVWHWIGLAPVLTVFIRGADTRYWLLAWAFAVSFIADAAAHVVDPLFVGVVYPVSQAALVGIALLPAREVAYLLVALVSAGIASVGLYDGSPSILLHVVAFGAVAGIAYRATNPSRLRVALLTYFGVGLVAWLSFAGFPSWTTYTVYQSTRIAGLALFCLAVVRPAPRLKVA